jgi:hypothetical protein
VTAPGMAIGSVPDCTSPIFGLSLPMFILIATSPVVKISNCLGFAIFLPGHYPTIPFVPRATGCCELFAAGLVSCGFENSFRLTAYQTINFLLNFPTHDIE